MTSYSKATWRLLITDPADGPMNMAVDEAILAGIAQGDSPPTLRFFAWDPPCLSLGFSQAQADADSARLQAHGWGLVRRPTGGKAILHADELTYSVIAAQSDPRVEGGIVESYRRLSEGLVRGLARMDLIVQNDRVTEKPVRSDEEAPGSDEAICFEVPSNYEITILGKKLIGSAQARRQGVVLQHGTLPLTGDIARICEALAFADEAARDRARERVRARAITLEGALGRAVSWEQAANAMKHGFREALTLELARGELSPAERERAKRLREEKYGRVE
jgi:lipoyl(octanoyl) transferase